MGEFMEALVIVTGPRKNFENYFCDDSPTALDTHRKQTRSGAGSSPNSGKIKRKLIKGCLDPESLAY